MSDEERARALRERLGRRLSWGQVGVPEDGALLVECYEVLGRLSAARAEGEAAGRAQGHEEAAEAIDGELCPRCDTDIALSTWARVFREKAAAIRARKEG